MASDVRKSAAYHEAGHAAAACLLEVPFEKAGNRKESSCGHVTWNVLQDYRWQAPRSKEREALERRVQVAMAGPVAEGILRGETRPYWEGGFSGGS